MTFFSKERLAELNTDSAVATLKDLVGKGAIDRSTAESAMREAGAYEAEIANALSHACDTSATWL